MKETKRQFKMFSFFDFDGITAYLEKMAAEGWMIEKSKNSYWVYRRTEPRKLKFAVTYFPKASDFDPRPTEELQNFNDFCASAGWQPAVSWGQMQIYYNENENPVPIETDPVVQVNNIHSAMKRNYIPSYLLMIVMSVFVIIMYSGIIISDPVGSFSSTAQPFALLAYLVLLINSVFEVGKYLMWYRKAVKQANEGFPVQSGKTSVTMQLSGLALVLGLVMIYYGYMSTKFHLWFLIAMLVLFSMSGVIAVFLKDLLKSRQVSRNTNKIVTFTVACGISLFLVFSFTMYIIRNDIPISTTESQPVGEYTKWNMTWEIYDDPVPLKLEDFIETGYHKYSYHNRRQESFLVSEFVIDQSATVDSDGVPELRYSIVKVHADILYDICFNDIYYDMDESKEDSDLPREFRAKLIEQDATPWQADKAYRLSYEGEFIDCWLVCWDNKIVDIRLYDCNGLTDRQMNIIGEKLKDF